jgi:hypothetical protein
VNEVAIQAHPVSAVDPAGGAVTLGLTGAPAFATLSDNGDGTGTLVIAPGLGDAGDHVLAVTATGGSGTSTREVSVAVAAVTPVWGGLFYEPPSFCLSGTETGDTLTVYNRSASGSLIIQPVRTVSGADALNARRVLDPEAVLDVPWSWVPGAPYPRTDTLIALTNDPQRPLLVLPLRREDPAGFSDSSAPDAPLLAAPLDGSVFPLVYNPDTGTNEAEIVLVWSAVDDCSGIDHYLLQIAADPGFTNKLLPDVSLPGSVAVLVAEDGDQGAAYWRVFAVDANGFTSAASAARSWIVVGP